MLNRVSLIVILLVSLISQISLSKTIDYLVTGVISSSHKGQGIALLKHKTSGKTFVIREGEKIQADITLLRVERRYVHLLWNDESYRLDVGEEFLRNLPRPPTRDENLQAEKQAAPTDLRQIAGIERQGNVLTVSESLKDSLVGENLSTILMQAAAVPHTKDGKLVGFQLLEIDEGSIFDVAGFKNGDVITHINEQPINNAAYALRALNNLRQAKQASFNYLRQDTEHELTVQIN